MVKTYRPDPEQVRTGGSARGDPESDAENGELLDEIDELCQRMRDSAIDTVENALTDTGEAARKTILVHGLRLAKPLGDLAAEFGSVIGAEIGRRLRGEPLAEAPPDDTEQEVDDDPYADPDDTWSGRS